MRVLKIKSNNILYFEDTKAEEIYVIKSGTIYLRKSNDEFYFKNGKLNSKITLHQGDMFGFREIFLKIKRESRAVAITDCEIIVFTLEDFSKFLKSHVEIGKKVLTNLSTNIRETSNRIKKISAQKKPPTIGSGNLYDIYLYFLRNNDLKKAIQVLDRMEINNIEVNFLIKEKKRINAFLELDSFDITNETIEKTKEIYVHEQEVLQHLLIGMKGNVFEKNVHEKLLIEIIKIKISENRIKTNLVELEEFVKKFPQSEFFKDMMFLLLDCYKEKGEYMKAYKITHMLSETKLTDEEKEKFKNTINFLKNAVGSKGSETHV